MSLHRFHVPDMDCAGEVRALEKVLGGVPGIRRLRFDLVARVLTVVSAEDGPNSAQILERTRPTGLSVTPAENGDHDHPEDRRRRWATLVSGSLLAAAGALHVAWTGADAAAPGPAIAVYLAATAIGGFTILPRALRSARALRADMNVLMTLAVVGALLMQQWPEAAAVTFLFCLAQWLDTWSISRARHAVRALMRLAPTTAWVIQGPDLTGAAGSAETRYPVEEVMPGWVVLVRPGETVPVDGTVRVGAGHVDQSPITGESTPVPKRPGAEVFAGSLNGEAALEVTATRAAEDSTLARIARMVEEAQGQRAPVERWVDRFARAYTPAVMALAAGVAGIPPLAWQAGWQESIYRALVLLVISCPCALVISTPVSLAAALAAAAHRGILVKGGAHLEVASRIRALALDKTGTLTYGEPAVVATVSLNPDHSERDVLERAAAIEGASEHPLAKAILRRARELGIETSRVEDFRSEQGLGGTGTYRERRFWVGGRRLLEQRGQGSAGIDTVLRQMEEAGRTVVLVGNDAHVCGAMAVADRVRDETRAALDAVRAVGVGHVIMLTGDHRTTALEIGGQSGTDEVISDLLPDQKVAVVQRLVRQYGTVAMVGDGINDAPALAAASLGIAMGGIGTDAALETADVVLMNDDLREVAWLVRHSRRTFAVVRTNLALSLVVKLAFLAITLGGAGTLWLAIAADMGASLAVIGNGLSLLRRRR